MTEIAEDTRRIITSDEKEFEVFMSVINMSKTLVDLCEDAPEGNIPLPNVNGETFARVIEYCTQHKGEVFVQPEDDSKKKETVLTEWDVAFYTPMAQGQIFELILAANYLDIKLLLDSACQVVANMIKGKTTEEIRAIFNIENDFSPEEEDQIRKENEWCEER